MAGPEAQAASPPLIPWGSRVLANAGATDKGAAWRDQTSSASFLSRLNGAYFLLDQGCSQTVFNDTASDTLTGSPGSDWFFAGTADKVTDLSALDQAFLFGV